MKTLLVTGGTGYLGRWLLPALRAKGFRILLLSRSCRNLPSANYIYTPGEAEKAFTSHKIWGVLHLAACYGRQNETAEEVFLANTAFPLRLLELAVKYRVLHFFNTDTILTPFLNFYSLSKNQFFQWLSLYVDKIQVTNLRLDHFYGPEDSPVKFVAWLVKNLKENTPVLNLTEGAQTRDFIYVEDVVAAYLQILSVADSFSLGKIYSFDVGSGVKTSVKEMVLLLHKMLKSSTKLNFGAVPYRKNEQLEYIVDVSALQSLGWRAKTSLKEGLRKILFQEEIKK